MVDIHTINFSRRSIKACKKQALDDCVAVENMSAVKVIGHPPVSQGETMMTQVRPV